MRRTRSSQNVRPVLQRWERRLLPALLGLSLSLACRTNRTEEQPGKAEEPAEEAPPERAGAGGGALRQAASPAPEPKNPSFLQQPNGVEFWPMLTDLEGRFSERPGIVASPCGFYVIRSEPGSAAQALLLGRDLGWTQPGRDQLLSVDSIVLDVGLVDATSMGAPDVRDEALLVLHGQWELAWLVRETGHASIPVRDAGSGKAHLPPHPPWRTWSVTLPEPLESDAGAFRHAVIGSVALGSRVLAIRALLPDETLAQRALKRVIFALDSLDQKDVSIDRTAFLASVEAAAQRDRTCRAVHDVYGAALE